MPRMKNNDVIKFRKFHNGQKAASRNMSRYTVWRMGRRFGKTTALEEIASHRAVKGLKIGWFAPSYKLIIPTYRRILQTVKPLQSTASKIDGLITLQTEGHIEFWSLDNEDAGRSRSYDLVIIDEASLKKKGLRDVWEQSIKPTLLDRGGSAIMAGTPKGIDEENYFYVACNNKDEGWSEYHAPTWDNPTLNAESVAKLEKENSLLVWRQEYCAEFVDWSGEAFFQLEKMLVDGHPVVPQPGAQYVYAVIDTATKTGREHDGTAVTYFARYQYFGHPLIILDWDIVQISGELLINWLPQVYANLEAYARELKAMNGSIGAFIEDKNSGTILIKQAQRAGLMASEIDSKLTAVGKDERSISVSGYFYRGMIKLSKHAYEKTIQYKGVEKNHFISQVCGVRIGVDSGADDLADTATYGVAIGLGDSSGF